MAQISHHETNNDTMPKNTFVWGEEEGGNFDLFFIRNVPYICVCVSKHCIDKVIAIIMSEMNRKSELIATWCPGLRLESQKEAERRLSYGKRACFGPRWKLELLAGSLGRNCSAIKEVFERRTRNGSFLQSVCTRDSGKRLLRAILVVVRRWCKCPTYALRPA